MHTQIVFGDGNIGVDKGTIITPKEHEGLPYVALFPLGNSGIVGERVDKLAQDATQATWLVFKTVESLEVVEKALAIAKQILIDKSKEENVCQSKPS